MNKAPIPIHHLAAKTLGGFDFEIVPLSEEYDYESDVPHRHNFYELILFTEGGGKHEIDFKEYAVFKNSVHLISPTQVHKLSLVGAQGFVLCFKEEFVPIYASQTFNEFYRFYDFTRFSPILKLDANFFCELMDVVNSMRASFDLNSAVKRDLLASYLTILLLKIKDYFFEHKMAEENSIAGSNQKIHDFKKLIDVNYVEHLSVNEYAERLNISSNYLNALCKKETGKTAIGLIHERLILEAKRLLYSTQLTVKEISHLLHFDSDAYFVRFFKKNVNQTPLDYRHKQV